MPENNNEMKQKNIFMLVQKNGSQNEKKNRLT